MKRSIPLIVLSVSLAASLSAQSPRLASRQMGRLAVEVTRGYLAGRETPLFRIPLGIVDFADDAESAKKHSAGW